MNPFMHAQVASFALLLMSLVATACDAGEFTGNALELRDVPLAVSIRTEEREGIDLTLSDGSDGGQYLEIAEQGDVLVIRGKPQGKRTMVSSPGNVVIGEVHQFVSGENAESTVIIGGQESTITSDSSKKKPRLSIRMPTNASLAVYGSCSQVDVGPLKRSLLLRVQGACSMTFTAIADADIRLEGAADVTIGTAKGALDVVILGAADLGVKDGLIGRLGLEVEGSANARIAARVESGSIRLSGASDVEINGRRGDFQASQSGVADLVFSPR